MLKFYLMRFEIFLDYVLMKGVRLYFFELDFEVKNQLFDFCMGLKKWRRCIIKEIIFVKWDCYFNELDQLLINEEVEDILIFKLVVDGRVVLLVVDQVESIEYFFNKQYCDVCDFFIVILIRVVRIRLVVFENVILEMFYKVKRDDNK